MPSRLYVRQGGAIGANSTELTAFTGRKGSPFFDGNDSLIEMGNRCGNGEASQGTFKLMDPDAELPRVDFQFNLPAHTLVTWTEDAPGDEIWLARGRNSSYEGGRGVALVDNEVEFDATVDDCNVELRGQAFTDPWERPAETDVARLIALQAYTLNGASSTATDHRDTCEVVVSSSHLTPNTNTVSMPAKTYPVGTQPQDVVQDCADTAGKIYGVVIHHTGTGGFTINVLLGLAAGSIKVSSPGPNPKTDAVDGDDATLSHWSSDITDGVDENYWAADLSASTPITRYRVKQGYSVIGPAEPEGASEMRIYGSNSAAAWSWLPSGVLTADPASNGWTQVESFSGSTTGSDTGPVDFAGGSYRYWLLRASAGPAAGVGEGWNIQEFELYSPLASHLCLLYTIETDHDTYASAVRISDHLDEWDPTDLTAPVFQPHWEAGKATIYDGQVNLSGLVNIYNASDSIYVSNPSDVDAYDYWVDSYFDSQSTTLTQATLRAGGLLTYRRLTNVTHRVSIIMLPEQTHLVTAGMSIDIKAAAAMGGQYLDTWQTRRIVEHKFEPRYDGTYWCHLDLDRTPHRRVPSSGASQPAATSPSTAADLGYDNSGSGLTADDMQEAIDELAAEAVTDHGALTGLADDDHPQYATNAEFDDHNARHETGGADAIKLDDLGAPDDNTDLNASTSAHGLLLKLGGGSTNFLRADGSWSAPPGAGTSPIVDIDTAGSSTSSTSFVDTNMAVAVADSTNYIFRAVVFFNTNASTVGIQFAVTMPAGATLKVGQFVATTASSTTSTTLSIGSTTANDTVIRATTTGPGASNVVALIEGTLLVAGTAGTLTLRYASETASAVTIEAGSYLMAQAI